MKTHSIQVTSALDIAAPASAVWARLCDAEMPATTPCEFRLGFLSPPRPLSCELAEHLARMSWAAPDSVLLDWDRIG